MQLNDDYIVNKFFTKANQINWARLRKAPKDEINYINNRFNEKSRSIKESLFRIKLHIEYIPRCPICGNLCLFENRIKRPYSTTCSKQCGIIYTRQKGQETRLLKYGHPYWSNWEKTKQTVKDKYGDHGIAGNPEIQQRIRKTCLARYGVENQFMKNSPIRKKIINTWKEKYGTDNPAKSQAIKEKIKLTNIERYGGNAPVCNENVKQKMFNTCIEKYGVRNWFLTEEARIKSHSDESKHKQYETKKKNNSFNSSKQEPLAKELLISKYADVKFQYKSESYPFICDFYIPSLDLYIECNFHWTHGGKPYIKDDVNCIKQLEHWKQKSENSQFYKNAIHTWTIRDVNKRYVASKNKLNYIEFWNIEEIKTWLNNIK